MVVESDPTFRVFLVPLLFVLVESERLAELLVLEPLEVLSHTAV